MEQENNNQTEIEKKLKWYEQKYGPYYETRGLKNWKNLFRKPTLMERTLSLVIILMLLGAWAWHIDTEKCRDTLKNLPREVCEACREFQTNKDAYETDGGFDFGTLNVTFVDETGGES